jgi:hypothetical protein
MARRKKPQKQKMDKARLLEDIKTAKVGEYCYFLDYSNKILWGEIQKISEENNQLLLHIMEEKDSRFYAISSEKCAFSEKIIKEKKGGK